MFTILKQQFKDYIARFVYNFLRTGYDLEHWTRTVSCSACGKPVAVDGRFCAYCGWAITSLNSQPYITTGANTTGISPNSEPINLEPVTIMLPRYGTKRHFLNYVRTQREQIGPATQAHRIFQDYGQRR